MNIQTPILIIDQDKNTVNEMEKWISENPSLQGTGAYSDEDAIEKFHQYHFDVVLLSDSINDERELKLRAIFRRQNPEIVIILFNRNNRDTVHAMIRDACNKKKEMNRVSVTITDDALLNAGLQIRIQ